MTLTFNIRTLVLIVFAASASFAQVKTLTEAEYELAINEAYDATAKKIHRSTSTNQSFEAGKIVRSSTVTEENIPPDKSRLLIDRRGTERSRYEVITIGDDVYEKDNSEKWEKSEKRIPQKFTVAGNPMDVPETLKYTLADLRLNGVAVRVYSKHRDSLSSFENTLYNLKAGVSLKVIWVNKKGLIVKTEETVSDRDTRVVVDKTVENYDYKPKGLEIIAPIK